MPGPTTILVGTHATISEILSALGDDSGILGCITLDSAPKGLPVLAKAKKLDKLQGRGIQKAYISIPASLDADSIASQLEAMGIKTVILTPITDQLSDVAVAPSIKLQSADLDVASLIGRTPHPIDRKAVAKLIRGKRVLVTGAGGSIGSEIAAIAASYGPEQIILMERAENALFEIDRRIREEFPAVTRCAVLHDVVDTEGTKAHLCELRPDIVFHAAAHKHVPLMEDHPAHAITNNVFGTKSIADASITAGVGRFVLISSDKAVNPSSVMGATKRLAERYIQGIQRQRAGDTKLSMVRFGNVLGSACSVLPIWSSQLAKSRPITVTDKRMTRYFMTIPEAAALVIQSAALPHDGTRAPVFVLDMGEPIKILDLAKRLCAATGIAKGSEPIILTGARPGEKLHEELAYDAEQLAPTRFAGINTWAGHLPDDFDLKALITDLGKVRASRDRDAVITMIRRHVPEMIAKAAVVAELKSGVETKAPSGAAA